MIAKRVNVDLKDDLAAWVVFAAGRKDKSKTEYINDAIRADMEQERPDVLEAFRAFCAVLDKDGE